jgi:hypothetical protein
MNALTVRGQNKGRLLVIASKVGICLPFPQTQPMPPNTVIKEFNGIWDTGATGSVITANVVTALGLIPTGQKQVYTAKGPQYTNTYLVNIALPMGVMVPNIAVTEGNLHEVDVLIGMDIITLGDFSITNKDGNTVMSFRVPSTVEHDYVPEANNHNSFDRLKSQRRLSNTIPRPPVQKFKRKKRR